MYISKRVGLIFAIMLVIFFRDLPIQAQESEIFEKQIELGHGPAQLVNWSPNGQFLAVAGRGDISIYQSNLEPLHALDHVGLITDLAWNSKSTLLASAEVDGTVILWDTVMGIRSSTLVGLGPDFVGAAFSPSGETVAAVDEQGNLVFWDVATKEVSSTWDVFDDTYSILDFAFNPNGTNVAIGAIGPLGAEIRIWNLGIQQVISSIPNGPEFAWHPDSRQLLISDNPLEGSSVYVWDLETQDFVISLPSETRIGSVTWSPKGDFFAIAGGSFSTERPDENHGIVAVWDANSLQEETLIESIHYSIAISWGANDHLASVTDDNIVQLWSPETGDLLNMAYDRSGEVETLAWSPNGTQIATGHDDGIVRIWDARTGEILGALEGDRTRLVSLAWNRHGTQFAGATLKAIFVWDASSLERIQAFNDMSRIVVWSPKSDLLATSRRFEDGIQLWDTNTWQPLTVLGDNYIVAAAFTHDGMRLALASDKVRAYDVLSGELLLELDAHGRTITWSPDADRLIVSYPGGGDFNASLWDTDDGRFLGIISEELFVVWQPNGQLLAGVQMRGRSDLIVIRDATTSLVVASWEGHIWAINILAWSHDGKYLASGSGDYTVKIWSINH